MARTSFLFWNTHRKPLAHLVAALASDHRSDLVILLEDPTPEEEILGALNSNGSVQFFAHESLGRKFRVYARFPIGSLRPVFGNDNGNLAMWRLALPDCEEILLVVVHGPTKLYSSDDSQALECTQIAAAIQQQEGKTGHSRTVLVGDLNMNPFETGVVGAGGLHAVMSQAVARNGSRIVNSVSYPFFYNPMWSRMGDASPGPCGTFYYKGRSRRCIFGTPSIRSSCVPSFWIVSTSVVYLCRQWLAKLL
jgi:hypothetical protein